MASAEMTAVEKSVGSTRTRFANDGEIYYCIASILKYAPFINKIFVITDNQRPKFINYFIMEGICDDKKIIFVNHTDIFGKNKNHYPTFNSLSIETMLWNIDNLSNSVIYFNDDVFLLSGVEKSDFISLEAKPILRGEFCPHPNLTTPWCQSALNWDPTSACKRDPPVVWSSRLRVWRGAVGGAANSQPQSVLDRGLRRVS